MDGFNVGTRQVGPGSPCFIIAEAGVNHNGDMDIARQLVDAATLAGADAVKFQTFTANRLVTIDAPKAEYQKETTGSSEGQWEMIHRLELSADQHRELMEYCCAKKVLFMSSPFDELSADLLEELNVAVFKIPSGEITNLPFLSHIANMGKPMIVSTGMSNLNEVEAAVQTIEATQNHNYILLQCTSNYPADPADANLAAMSTMATEFGAMVGYSDHTPGIAVALAAAALGACVIEKHLTTDQTLPGPDHRASLEPKDFKKMVQGIRSVEVALGHGRKEPAASEAHTATIVRKSLVAAQDIPQGVKLTETMITTKRPGTGLGPAMRSKVVGRSALVDIPVEAIITLEMLS